MSCNCVGGQHGGNQSPVLWNPQQNNKANLQKRSGTVISQSILDYIRTGIHPNANTRREGRSTLFSYTVQKFSPTTQASNFPPFFFPRVVTPPPVVNIPTKIETNESLPTSTSASTSTSTTVSVSTKPSVLVTTSTTTTLMPDFTEVTEKENISTTPANDTRYDKTTPVPVTSGSTEFGDVNSSETWFLEEEQDENKQDENEQNKNEQDENNMKSINQGDKNSGNDESSEDFETDEIGSINSDEFDDQKQDENQKKSSEGDFEILSSDENWEWLL